MTQPEQPRGNFPLNLNFRRNGNAKAPPITGRISTPEDPETEFAFSAFQHTCPLRVIATGESGGS